VQTIVGFLSRAHGYNVLTNLGKMNEFKFLKIYTHKYNPKSQDPNKGVRDDYELFVNECKKLSIPLVPIDSKSIEITNCPECDYIVEISWRYIIPSKIVKKSRIGTFGVHRGKLPDYAGSEPIKQALKNNERKIILSAHKLEPKIDSGNVITTSVYDLKDNFNQKTPEKQIQEIRDAITPLFSVIVLNTIKILNNK
jgi:methionyl-tRNA formyltransferase